MSKDRRAAAEEEVSPFSRLHTMVAGPVGGDEDEVRVQSQLNAQSLQMQTSQVHSSITAKLKEAYRAQDTLPKLIDDESVREQSLEDYYIKLQIILRESLSQTASGSGFDSVSGDKQSIEMVDIFSQVDEDHPEAHKILLLGAAGIGKTTLMHYMSYMWGKGDFWQNEYDFVFRVRLKNLLNEDWSRFYQPSDLDDNTLACFVHSCLPRGLSRGKDKITVTEIASLLETDSSSRTLLLLDGFDEVANKVARNGSIPARIFEEVFKCPNMVLTSRPNAVSDEFKRKFDRAVENVGLDDYGIEKYIEKAFATATEEPISDGNIDSGMRSLVAAEEVSIPEMQDLSLQLKDFLAHNLTIHKICTIPINLALVCIVWQDAKEKLQSEEFNMSTLYHEVVLWLGKKYLKKFDDDYAGDKVVAISPETIYASNEVQALKQIAYRGFTESEALVLHGQNVETYAREVWSRSGVKTEKILEMVNRYGLIKSERDEKTYYRMNLALFT